MRRFTRGILGTTVVLTMALIWSGCSMVKKLRQEAYQDEPGYTSPLMKKGGTPYAGPKRALPPPVSILDRSLPDVEGTPVDLAGIRAKSGHVTKADFDSLNSKNENSLWKEDGQSNYLFASNRQLQPGDLVQIELEEELKRDVVSQFRKTLNDEEKALGSVPGFTKPGSPKAPAVAAAPASNAAPGTDDANRAPADAGAAQAGASTPASSVPTSNAEPELVTTPLFATAEVLQKLPNGNVILRGVKRIPFPSGTRNMEIVSIVRGSDIGEDGVVKSSKFFEHRVEAYR